MRIPSRVYANNDLATRPERLQKSDPEKAGPAAPPKRVGAGGIKVTVSAEARALAAENAMDGAKVARLQAALAAGALAIDARLIASRLVESGG
jgi:anti-sigma28 factor (negative regulator of flagellin synthesis)